MSRAKGGISGAAAERKASVECMRCARQGVEGRYLQPLLLGAPVQQLLDEVVTKGVHHQLYQVVQHLREDHGNGGRPSLIKLTLKEAAAVLILGDR